MTISKNNAGGWFSSIMILVFMQPVSVQAQVIDPLIEGAKLCTRHLQHYEREYGIPAHLLSAIASTESGRYHDGLKIKLPWPWTINAEGKGYFFDTKEEAMAAARKLFARGVESMDIGCMQVNLHHHPAAFSSISQAFEPENNVAYAASFLRSLYQDEGSWKKAASNYHSKTPQLGSKYVGLVYDSWFKIVDKLRTARLNIPSSSVKGLQEMQQANAADSILSSPAPAKSAAKYIKVSDEENTKKSAYKSPHMKTIRVTPEGATARNGESRRHENGVIVVHPEITVVGNSIIAPDKNSPPEPMIMADANPINSRQSILDLPNAAANSPAPLSTPEAKIIRIDNKLVNRRPVNTQVIKKAGPNFIFND